MTPESSTSQIEELREQLNLQAEAILKLVEVVSGLEGVDPASLGTYAVRVQRLQIDPIVSPTGDARSIDAPSPAPEPSQPAQSPGERVSPDNKPPGIT